MPVRHETIHFSWAKLRDWMLLSLLLLAVGTSSGCGQGQYEERMDKQITELRRSESANPRDDSASEESNDEADDY